MRRKSIILMVALAICLIVSSALANTVNVRPISGGSGSLDPLQDVFTGIGSSIDVYEDQSSAAVFTYSGSSVGSMFVASVTLGYAAEVGLYKYGSSTTQVTLYDGILAGYTAAKTVQIYFGPTGTVSTYDPESSTTIDTEVGFGSEFGFYIKTAQYGTWYSEDSLNNGLAQALMFEGIAGDKVNIGPYTNLEDRDHWYAAFEIANNDGSWPWGEGNIDFNDAVIRLESINPVPEPASMLLLGFGLIGLAGVGRKFKK